MLVGLPGTGKSHIREMYSYPIDWKILSTDDIIEELCRENDTNYSEGFQKFVGAAHQIMDRKIEEYADSNVIWDQTNLTRKVRVQKLLKFPNHEKHAICVLPKTTDEIFADMVKYRPDKVIPKHVIENMAETFEYPTTLEGFETVTFYTTEQIFGENSKISVDTI